MNKNSDLLNTALPWWFAGNYIWRQITCNIKEGIPTRKGKNRGGGGAVANGAMDNRNPLRIFWTFSEINVKLLSLGPS